LEQWRRPGRDVGKFADERYEALNLIGPIDATVRVSSGYSRQIRPVYSEIIKIRPAALAWSNI
jgi:hypothetical protein